MKAKIDEYGNLYLLRKNKIKAQFCPKVRDEIPCGDWCSLFHEPEEEDEERIFLEICERLFEVRKEDFVDERKNEDER